MSNNFRHKTEHISMNYYDHHWKKQYKSNRYSTNVILRNKLAECRHMHRHDLVGHFGCVNAIEFSSGCGEFIASGIIKLI